jgi:hypothetical protein
MMEYENTKSSALPNLVGDAACIDRPYLARIADAADELERIGSYIEDFIDRFRGGDLATQKVGPTPVPSGHFGQLERLQDNIVRVDKLARELQTIG